MTHMKRTALVCALFLTAPLYISAADAEMSPSAEGKPISASEPIGEGDALLRALDLTLPAVQSAVEAGTFRNMSPAEPQVSVPMPEPIAEPMAESEPMAEDVSTNTDAEMAEEESAESQVSLPAGESSQGTAASVLDKDGVYNGGVYVTDKNDENALRISMAYVTADDVAVRKTGDSAHAAVSAENGLNAALLITHGARASLKNGAIASDALGGTGVFVYGKSGYLNLTKGKITTKGVSSPAVVVAERAMMKAVDLDVETDGASSSALRLEKDGILLVEGGTYVTRGAQSHGLYSEGDITVTGSVIRAEKTKAAVIKGNNTITLTDTTLEGNEITDKEPHNVVLFSNESDIGTMGTQQFEMTGGEMVCGKGDLFYVTATHGKITLRHVNLVHRDTAGDLFRVTGNDGVNGWGTPGSNGGHATVVADNQVLSGNITVDAISDINLSLQNGSVFSGTIRIIPNEAGGDPYKTNADVFIGKGSVWNLTDDAHVSSLLNLGTIRYNGHTVTLADGTVMGE